MRLRLEPLVALCLGLGLCAAALGALGTGCGDDDAPPPPVDAGAPDAGPPPDAGAPVDAGDIVCDSDGVQRFRRFDRTCAAAADCAAAMLQVDCCGSMLATGIRASEAGGFAEAAAECAAMYPACRCAAQPTRADDGSTEAAGGAVTLDCQGGACRTAFR